MQIKEALGWKNGEVIATPYSWELSFYLPGPDLRYNDGWFKVGRKEIASLVEEYRRAFERFETLKRTAPSGATVTESCGRLTVRLGGFNTGVCMAGYHHPVSKSSELTKVLALLERAIARGEFLMHSAKALQQA